MNFKLLLYTQLLRYNHNITVTIMVIIIITYPPLHHHFYYYYIFFLEDCSIKEEDHNSLGTRVVGMSVTEMQFSTNITVTIKFTLEQVMSNRLNRKK